MLTNSSSQAVIVVAYLMYGIYVYALQGQYTLALAYQGLNNYAWQTTCNAIALVTGAIAAALCSSTSSTPFLRSAADSV